MERSRCHLLKKRHRGEILEKVVLKETQTVFLVITKTACDCIIAKFTVIS